ncbi:MAG: hypothetical protein IT160_18785 [Bryobacterales bacterium]|nr:hypothetical protein [Bryobacterales bacterium]
MLITASAFFLDKIGVLSSLNRDNFFFHPEQTGGVGGCRAGNPLRYD